MVNNCCHIIKKIIKKCDYFATFVTFRINDEIEYKSIVGGLTSIIFFLLAVTYTIYVGYPFIKRENIEFIFSNKIIESQPFINLTSINFNLAFGIQYQENAFSAIEDFKDYFNYSFIIKEWIGTDTIIEFPFGLKKCTKDDFFNLVNESFDRNLISGMLCPVLNKSANYTLDGLYTDYYYKFFELEIKLTENGMANLNRIKELMQNNKIEMAIYFLDTAIHYKNRSNPLPHYINYLVKGLDINFIKTTEISLSTIEFTNDENLLFTNKKTIIGASFDKNEDSFHLVSSRNEIEENLIGKFIIKASSKVIVLDRSYQKLPSFLADLTGILEEILLIILVLINIMERQAIDNKLIHKMLKIKGSKYYDVDYFLSVFNRDKVNNEVMNLIKRGNFQIERSTTGGVYSKRKSIMTILDNEKFGNMKMKKKLNSRSTKIIPINPYKNNNFFGKESPNEYPKLNDNNLNIQSSERDFIKISNYNKNKNYKAKEIDLKKEESITINSIPSIDIETLENKKKSTLIKNMNNITNDNKNKNNDINNSLINNNQSDINNQNLYQSNRQLTTNINIENTDNNDLSFETKINKKDDIKKAEEDFHKIGVVNAVFTSVCYWSSKYKKRSYELLIRAERKVHYYLDVFNYIKGMQEIDLLKYCLFDKEQSVLFNYLASPPFKLTSKMTNSIYKEFEKEQVVFGKIKKNEIDEVYNCYNIIRTKNDITFEDLKLLRLINAEAELLSQ